jgi:hypothetical protein
MREPIHAITVSPEKRVIITFSNDAEVAQLTPRGVRKVTQLTCTIYNEALKVIGQGVALKSPEDVDDPVVGMKLALTRALEDAVFSITRDERGAIWGVFNAERQHVEAARRNRTELRVRLRKLLASAYNPGALGGVIGAGGY